MMAPSGWIALMSLWGLFFWLYRDYRLDFFRQRLFAIRDDLFDLASDGHVAFDSPAYGMLRSTINGTIQYGHQLGFLELLSTLIVTKKDPMADRLIAQFDNRWEEACKSLEEETRQKLQTIRTRLHFAMFEQVVFTSFLLTATLVAVFFAISLVFLKAAILRKLEEWFESSRWRSFFSKLDCSAAMHAS